MNHFTISRLFLAAWGCLSFYSVNAQTGPLVGTVKTEEALFLYRPGDIEKSLRLSVLGIDQQVVASCQSNTKIAHDCVAKFHITGLTHSTAYTYRIDDMSSGTPVEIVGPDDGLRFKTDSPSGAKTISTVAFVSCANSSTEPVWQRIGMLNVDRIILGGDTPYIDVADLPTIRLKHRNFLESPSLKNLIRRTSIVATWDDHDFGLNNGNGENAKDRKANTRQAFMEYRAHDQYGTGTEGIYHSVTNGPMEIFLLDPRWWSQTAASPVAPAKKTCFGPEQWGWIQKALENSKSPFKILAMGQIWQDKKNSENDDMFTYHHERDALFDFIRSKKIPGVVLVGGDIHVSRHLVHRQRTGYDLHDFISSPSHNSVIKHLDVTHPDLEWSSQEPRQFLTLTADTQTNPAVLTARYYLADGSIQREVVIPYDQMIPKEGTALGKGLRVWWSFDDEKNNSVLGNRFDAVAVNGASFTPNGGLRGGAGLLFSAQQQYFQIGRQALNNSPVLSERAGRCPLDDNSGAHTLSLWCKPETLPVHLSNERHFLLESALGGSPDPGFHMSIGFRPTPTDAKKINLELYTVTLQAADATSTSSPKALAQGPFACELDRSIFTNRWTHVLMTFEEKQLTLHVDGKVVASHPLPVSGPAAEWAGLIIGGHRGGVGRNFNGMIDEVALWQRVLEPSEITALYNSGIPQSLPTEVRLVDQKSDSKTD